MKIRVQLSLFTTLGMLLLTVLVLLFFAISSRNMIDARVYKQEIPAQLKKIRNAVELELTVPITLAKSIAENYFIEQWVKDNERPEVAQSIINYLDKVKVENSANRTFFISSKSNNYYTNDGFKRTSTYDSDPWFFDLLESTEDYSLSFAVNADQTPTIYVNYRVLGKDGEVLGVAGLGMSLSVMRETVANVDIGANGEVFLVDGNGLITIHNNAQALTDLDTYLGNEGAKKYLLSGNELHFQEIDRFGQSHIVAVMPIRIGDWSVVLMQQKSALYISLNGMLKKTFFVSAVLLLFVTLLIYFISSKFVRPIENVSNVLQDIANSKGDLTRYIKSSKNDELGALIRAYNQFVENLRNQVLSISKSSSFINDSVIRSTTAISSSNEQVDLQQQKTSFVVTAIHEMSKTIEVIAINATQAAEESSTIFDSTLKGEEAVKDSVKTVQYVASEIDKASSSVSSLSNDVQNIGKMLDVIRGISEQTNLLALNAAIEAARAGEQGRGFAVVADEVRTLARRTQDSTQEISEIIEDLNKSAENSVELMNCGTEAVQSGVNAVNALLPILEGIRQATDSMSGMNYEIASAAEEQAAVAEDISRNIADIVKQGENTVTQVNIADKECEAMRNEVVNLDNIVAQFKT